MLGVKVALILCSIWGAVNAYYGNYQSHGHRHHHVDCWRQYGCLRRGPPICEQWCIVYVTIGYCQQARYQCCSYREKPVYCPSVQSACAWPFPYFRTKHYECSHDYNCPTGFKCCHDSCFTHKICKPYINAPPQPVATTTCCAWNTEKTTPKTTIRQPTMSTVTSRTTTETPTTLEETTPELTTTEETTTKEETTTATLESKETTERFTTTLEPEEIATEAETTTDTSVPEQTTTVWLTATLEPEEITTEEEPTTVSLIPETTATTTTAPTLETEETTTEGRPATTPLEETTTEQTTEQTSEPEGTTMKPEEATETTVRVATTTEEFEASGSGDFEVPDPAAARFFDGPIDDEDFREFGDYAVY